MSISYLLVLIGLAAFGAAVWALFWAVDSGQYDDLERHASTALEEEGGDSGAGVKSGDSRGDADRPGKLQEPLR